MFQFICCTEGLPRASWIQCADGRRFQKVRTHQSESDGGLSSGKTHPEFREKDLDDSKTVFYVFFFQQLGQRNWSEMEG